MLSKEDFLMIQERRKQGVYLKDIADDLGVHPKTVSRALKRGKAPIGKRPKAHKSKLDPYKPMIDRLLREGVWNAVVIVAELREAGYSHSYSLVKRYVSPKRALRQSKATVRFETNPGEQLQNDWGEIWTMVAGKRTKVHFSTNVLGYSRRFHFWCTDSQDAEHTYEGIIRAMEHFGGVTDTVLVDNQKALVVQHRKGSVVRFHERFVDLASCYGFRPRACRPYRAQTKGKDERMVSYIKHHFFVRYREFESLSHMNRLAELWLREVADQRIHGTVKEVVMDRYERERSHLKTLPTRRYDTSYRETRMVSWDGYIDVRGNRYSVPDALRGRSVVVRIGLDDIFRVLDGGVKVAEHRLRSIEEGWSTIPSHHLGLWEKTLHVEQRSLRVYEEVASCN